MHVIEYDEKSLLNYNQDKSLDTAHPQALMGSHEYSNSIQQFSIPSLPHPVHTGQPSMGTGGTVGGTYFLIKHSYVSNKSKRVLQLFWFTLLSLLLFYSCVLPNLFFTLFNTLIASKISIQTSIC